MPFHTQPVLVASFSHKGRAIDIMKAVIGATCCAVEHYARRAVCTVCNEPLNHRLLFFPHIDGEPREDLAEDTEDGAITAAEKAVDAMDVGSGTAPNILTKTTPGTMPPTDHRPPTTGFEPPSTAIAQMKALGWPEWAMAIVAAHPKK